jgi:curved DNA-binding protein
VAANLYDELGVGRGASQDEIKRAYRRLAAQYHPDRNPDDKSAEDRFKAINRAHQVLSDKEKRELYDEFGDVALREGFDARAARAYTRARTPFQGGGNGTGFNFQDIFNAGGGAAGRSGNFSDIFGDVFRSQGRRRAAKGADLESEVSVDLVAAIRGSEVMLRMSDGQELKVRIPPGAGEGDKVRVPGRGQPGQGGGVAGDLLIKVHLLQHPAFERKGLDLYLNLPITPREAYEGAKVSVPTPGGEVTLKVPKGSQSGNTVRLKAQGVSKRDKTGDLYVRFLIRLPEKESSKVAKAIEALEAALADEPPIRDNIKL